ncbi:MAG: ATP-binding protein [Mycoplasmataceae bacterium]|jgi:predicted ATPase|nr:ATP-binding protein [Mycoplasmataceae bacterium]
MGKQLIKSVTISKLWGIKDIKTEFNADVDIFIGANGTSKTTFLNLIESVLLADFQTLGNIEFESIIIQLQNNESQNKICVQKKHNEYSIISYSFNNKESLELPYSEFARRGVAFRPMRMNEMFQSIKDKLSEYVNISWLSVHRDNNQDDFERSRERNRNYIDERLDDLMRKLTVYQLQLESEASKIADKFKEEVFSLMLYNKDYDKVDVENLEQFNPTEIKEDLSKTFTSLGVNAKAKTDMIQLHMRKLEEVVGIIKNKPTSLKLDNVFPLSLVNRTISLIRISKENEERKQCIFKPIIVYLEYLKNFMPHKEFKLDKESSGQLEIHLKDKKNNDIKLPLFSLSSGEKQLIILFTETLLQKNEPFLFIADEPELSLHIEWQRKIIETLRGLNSNAQIIVATHSPEIAGRWKQNVINMEKIIYYE